MKTLIAFAFGVSSLLLSANTMAYGPVTDIVNGTGKVVRGVATGTGYVAGGVVRGTGHVVGGVARGTGHAVHSVSHGFRTGYHGGHVNRYGAHNRGVRR